VPDLILDAGTVLVDRVAELLCLADGEGLCRGELIDDGHLKTHVGSRGAGHTLDIVALEAIHIVGV
jgi:hypothetical protein